MIEHVRRVLKDVKRVYPGYDPKDGYELAGFAWFQGWNDMVAGGTYPKRGQPGGYDAYTECLAHFIRDVRTDLKAPDMKFVIGVMGVGGPYKQVLDNDLVEQVELVQEFAIAYLRKHALKENYYQQIYLRSREQIWQTWFLF